MSSGYIAFYYADYDFLVPLEQFHIILNPDEIIDKIGSPEDNINDIYFGSKLINIVHLSKFLNTEPRKIGSSSRLLVGEFKHQFIGFWVDSVKEIINVENDNFAPQKLFEEDFFIKKTNLDGQDYNVINLNSIVRDEVEIKDHHIN